MAAACTNFTPAPQPGALELERECLAAAVSARRPELSITQQDELVAQLSRVIANWVSYREQYYG